MHFIYVPALFLGIASAVSLPRQTTPTATIIPSTVFDSQANFNESFNYLYPWGNTHNGAARMDDNHVAISDGVLTLTAEFVTGQPSTTSGGETIAINYLSGTVYAKEQFTVAVGGGYDFTADFIAPTVRGTWPAFWLTAVVGWPPECDIAEWKGDGEISFNTFNTSSIVAADDVEYPNPEDFHTVKAELRDANGKDVKVEFFLDGVAQTTQWGEGFVGQALWLIIDLQMEGSSGSPGPTTDTTYSLRNLEVLSYNP